MPRASWLDSPFLVGFERMQELAERADRAASDGYPPYNIEDLGQGRLRITLAVAGFIAAELSAIQTGRELVIRGDRVKDEGRAFLHRGIAARRFQRTFVLADGVDVEAARLEHGLLHLDLQRLETASRVIDIATSPSSASSI